DRGRHVHRAFCVLLGLRDDLAHLVARLRRRDRRHCVHLCQSVRGRYDAHYLRERGRAHRTHGMNEHEALLHTDIAQDTTTLFGFWMYLMSDLVLFAALFAVYAVFRSNTFGGPTPGDIFTPHLVLIE